MIAIVDYGVGNLFSLVSSFKAIGADAVVTRDKEKIKNADKIVLPGVGAFSDAAKKLRQSGLDELIIEQASCGKPILGICLGMQLMFKRSFEYGCHEGLGLIDSDIIPFNEVLPSSFKIPHIGWNGLKIKNKDCPLFKYINDGDYVYFVHSYFAQSEIKECAASAEYAIDFAACVWKDNIYACQFHPEKSGEVGLNILKGFCEIGEN